MASGEFPSGTKFMYSLPAGCQIGKYLAYLGHSHLAVITVLLSSSSCYPYLVTFFCDKSLHLQKMPLDFASCAHDLGTWSIVGFIGKDQGAKKVTVLAVLAMQLTYSAATLEKKTHHIQRMYLLLFVCFLFVF